MNWVDIAILSVVLTSTLTGIFWGLIRQLVSIVGLVGGLFLAGRFYEPIANFLHGGETGGGLVADPGWARIIGFAVVVIGFSLLLGVVGSILRFVANLLLLGWLDHLLGGLLGLITSLLLILPLLIVATVFPVPNVSEAIKESVVAQWLGGLTPIVLAMLPPEFGAFREMMGWGPL